MSNLEEAKRKKLLAAALARLKAIDRTTAFDPIYPDSKPTAAQQEIIADFGVVKHQYVRAGSQSGKSQTCSRLTTWVLTDTHPTWKRPENWKIEPLLIIVAGRTGKQIESSLLPRIVSYLEPGTYKEHRQGGSIQWLDFASGDRIVFQSLENPVMARERLQSYTAHMAWVDELPPTVDILAELHRSIQAKNGMFLASFTPLTPSYEIQKFIDQVQEPLAKVYRLNMMDNPVYADPTRKQEVMSTLEHLPEKVRRSRLYGDWLTPDEQVYDFTYETMVRPIPDHYSTSWRHVESVDPAYSSALGLTVWGEDPHTNEWYCVLDEYVEGIRDPVALLNHVRSRTSKFNIVRRVCDSHEVAYMGLASREGVHYIPVMKNNRKMELIVGLQTKLGRKMFLTPNCRNLIAELQDCRWSDRGEGIIVAASKYHLLDSSQYFADNIPPVKQDSGGLMGDGIQASTWQEWLWKANERRKETRDNEMKQAKLDQERKASRRNIGRGNKPYNRSMWAR